MHSLLSYASLDNSNQMSGVLVSYMAVLSKKGTGEGTGWWGECLFTGG